MKAIYLDKNYLNERKIFVLLGNNILSDFLVLPTNVSVWNNKMVIAVKIKIVKYVKQAEGLRHARDAVNVG